MKEQYLSNAMAAYGPAVYRLALCRMQNTADAEDIYQEVFLRLWRQSAESWPAEQTKAWLIRTTLNRCSDLHRFRLRRPVLSLEELPEPVQNNSEAAELWAAVARLPEANRAVVHLYYAEGYSAEEIAQMLQIPDVTVRTRLYRARRQLKNLLGGNEHES